jgi:YgiT-type zinc finger domain-containing protein
MACAFCGKEEVRTRKLPQTFGEGDDLFIIEQVPVMSCPHCGENYLTSDTIRALDEILDERRTVAAKRPVLVTTFRPAA